jgi:hypothetical protein
MSVGETLVKLLGIQPHEKVLLLTDYEKEKIARVIFDELKEKARVKLFVMKTRSRDGEEPTEMAYKVMLKADVIIAVTSYSITHTRAVRECVKTV